MEDYGQPIAFEKAVEIAVLDAQVKAKAYVNKAGLKVQLDSPETISIERSSDLLLVEVDFPNKATVKAEKKT